MLRQSVSKLPFSFVRSSFIRSFASKKKNKTPCSLCPDEEEKAKQQAEAVIEPMFNYEDFGEKKTSTTKEEICKEHGEMIPDIGELKNLKSFELKSNCNSFHWLSEGHDR